ncbi:TetR/AcrR family transcriptional regulator [Domibacillus sp. A3M-37]|uniref:TetR/AcrR family transcriptional regulator n=1 Tax=Domibacillus sp. A3M-37 TaxID=2962037 RepID=UPI0020B690A6|nr:TetR/AcrR family transcriptional regulator [Domibacillus sp. A3M-37]MCP3762247.1 TetR/AcrR family transcriptional regulator [Domibacillus sp. A3M-37]
MKEMIKQAAASLFAEHGYAGTSLAQISEKVGIKKPSIYAHYKSKDHLFEYMLHDAFNAEMKRLEETNNLYGLLESYLFLYDEDSLFRFFLTSSFFPPDFLKENILQQYEAYLDALESKVRALLKLPPDQADDAAVMYTIILDSLFVELCYGTRKKSEKRLDVAWRVYEQQFLKGQEK